MNGEIPYLRFDSHFVVQLGKCDTQQVLAERIVMKQLHNTDQRQCNQNKQSTGNPCRDSFPTATRWRIQKACPNVIKICVALMPGIGLKLWPKSTRVGPTGVAYRKPKPTEFVH